MDKSRRRSALLKLSAFLLALAPIAAGNTRCIFMIIGEPEFPAKLLSKKDTL
ncbi:MAG: hypothetical protein FWE07_00810 [Turicibacter sp.]|nr:hypothetical protein [Turicibacter sp.]